MENLLAITRAAVLVGSVLFAFVLFAAGLYVTLREYRHVSSWPKLEQFIKLTSQGGLSADIAKGTVAMSRMRPGLLMMAIAAVVLCVLITRPLKYESSSTPVAGVATSPAVAVQVPPVPAEREKVAAPAELSVTDIRAFYGKMLDKWVALAGGLSGKPLTDWFRSLQASTGENTVRLEQRYSAKGETPASIAKVIYGDERYAALILSLNTEVSDASTPYPQYTLINILEPQVLTMPVATSVKLEIAGEGRKELYEDLADIAKQILADPQFMKDPKAWFNAHGFGDLLPMETFARGLDARTGRKWSTQWYYTSSGETPALVAKSVYRDSAYMPILRLANFDDLNVSALLAEPYKPLPPNTRIQTIDLVAP